PGADEDERRVVDRAVPVVHVVGYDLARDDRVLPDADVAVDVVAVEPRAEGARQRTLGEAEALEAEGVPQHLVVPLRPRLLAEQREREGARRRHEPLPRTSTSATATRSRAHAATAAISLALRRPPNRAAMISAMGSLTPTGRTSPIRR